MSAAGLGVATFLADAALRNRGITLKDKAPLRGFATLEVDGIGSAPKVFPTPGTSDGGTVTKAHVPPCDRVVKRLLEIKSNPGSCDDACQQLARSLVTMAIIHHMAHYHVPAIPESSAGLSIDAHAHAPAEYHLSGAVAFYDKDRADKAVRHRQLGLPRPAQLPADRASSSSSAAIPASSAAADFGFAAAVDAFAPFWCWHPGCSVIRSTAWLGRAAAQVEEALTLKRSLRNTALRLPV